MVDKEPWIDPDAMAASFQVRAAELLATLGTHVATSCAPDPPDGHFFLAEATADTSVGRVRLFYGDREFEVRTSVHPLGQPWPLELAFYLDAMGQDSTEVRNAMWVNTDDRLRRVLACHGQGLAACLDALSPNPTPLWEAADARRIAAIAEYKAQVRREELMAASERAAVAFREGNVSRVVELLAPYEDILSEAQSRKLKIARNRVRLRSS